MEEEWRDICTGFLDSWNFPHCVGAFDGKHVQIQAPPNSGSLFFNSSDIHLALQEKTLNLPKGTANLPGSNVKLPLFFLGDSGFPISINMMRPYSGKLLDERKKIFNYRFAINMYKN